MIFVKNITSIILIATLISCTTVVSIDSEPKGSDVFINHRYVGATPVKTELSDFAGNTYNVKIKKQGYQEVSAQLEKEIKAGAIIASIPFFFAPWPLLWVYGPQEEHYYKLYPIE